MMLNVCFCPEIESSEAVISHLHQVLLLHKDGTCTAMIQGVVETAKQTTNSLSRLCFWVPYRIVQTEAKGFGLTDSRNEELFSETFRFDEATRQLIFDGIKTEWSDYSTEIKPLGMESIIQIAFSRPILQSATSLHARRAFRIYFRALNVFESLGWLMAPRSISFISGRLSGAPLDTQVRSNIIIIKRWYCHLIAPPNTEIDYVQPPATQQKCGIKERMLTGYFGARFIKNQGFSTLEGTNSSAGSILNLEFIQWYNRVGQLEGITIPDSRMGELMFRVLVKQADLSRRLQIAGLALGLTGTLLAILSLFL